MKKIYTIILGLFTLTASAQTSITIDSTDVIGIGQQAIIATDDMPDSSIVSSSEGNVNWDFSALKSAYFDTLVFITPNTAAGGASFSDANIAFKDASMDGTGFTSHVFLQNTAAGLIGLGTSLDDGSGQPIIIRLSSEEVVTPFPASFGNTFATTAYVDTTFAYDATVNGYDIDSVRIIRYKSKDMSIDAFGDLTTPAGTFPTIRVSNHQIQYDTIYFNVKVPFLGNIWQLAPDPFTTAPDTSDIYSWYGKDHGYALVEMEVDTNTGFPVGSVQWLTLNSSLTAVSHLSCTSSVKGSASVIAGGGGAPYTYSWNSTPPQNTPSATNLDAGIYTVPTTDQNGLMDTLMVEIKGVPGPVNADFTITYTGGQMTVNTNSTSTGAETYTWHWGDGDSLQGTSTSTHIYSTYGVKTICLDVRNRCFQDSVCRDVKITGVGINELNKGGYSIYPNPAKDQIMIEHPVNAMIYIYDNTGRLVLNKQLSGKRSSISVSDFEKGIYLFEVISSEGVVKGKIVKE